MYKEIIICSIVIIIVVGLNILTESYTKESITLMTGDLKSLKENKLDRIVAGSYVCKSANFDKQIEKLENVVK